MGFFNRQKKKAEQETHGIGYQYSSINQQLFREVTQEVALFMFEVGITKQPGLSCFYDDKGIFEGIFIQHTTNPNILALKRISDDAYLQVVGMHAFGAGAYVTVKQLDYGHQVNEFTSDELKRIALDFQQTDAYELSLKRLKIPVDSSNNKILDQIIITGLNTAKATVEDRIMEPQNLKAYMQVLYNAGISMYMMRRTN